MISSLVIRAGASFISVHFALNATSSPVILSDLSPCHSERSEESLRRFERFFAALRMTGRAVLDLLHERLLGLTPPWSSSSVNRHDLFGEVAGGVMLPSFLRLENGFDLTAYILRHRAARMEATAGRKLDGAWQIAGEDDALAALLDLRVRNRNSRE